MRDPAASTRSALECVIAFVCGAIILVIPVALAPTTISHPYPVKFLPLVATAVERVELYSLGLLLALGLVLGYFARSSALLLAVCAVLIFPLWSLADMLFGGDHSLLPFEWLVYAAYVLLPLVGIVTVRMAKRTFVSGA